MNNLIGLLLQPILNAALQFVIAVAQEIAPEVAADLKDFFEKVGEIAASAATLDLTLPEALDALKMEANLLKERGETLVIELQAKAQEFPAKLYGTFAGLVGNLVGPLEKLAGI